MNQIFELKMIQVNKKLGNKDQSTVAPCKSVNLFYILYWNLQPFLGALVVLQSTPRAKVKQTVVLAKVNFTSLLGFSEISQTHIFQQALTQAFLFSFLLLYCPEESLVHPVRMGCLTDSCSVHPLGPGSFL